MAISEMRVLLVTHSYPPYGVAGVERLSAQTARALTSRGHDVTVFARRPSAAPPHLRVEQHRSESASVLLVSGYSPPGDELVAQAAIERIFERCFLDVNPDVVLISHLMHHSPLYVFIAHRWNVPVVLELHDFFFACPRAHLERTNGSQCGGPQGGVSCARYCYPREKSVERKTALRAHLFRRALVEADAVLCPSEFVARYFAKSVGVRRSYSILGNGVDIKAPVPREKLDRTLKLASISVLVPHKGIHVALEALRLANLDAVEYAVFGAATEPYLQQLLGLADAVPGLRFRAYGSFDRGQLPMLLGDVDALVIPSLVSETYSIVAREALACGVPVIASRIGALPDAIREGYNGLLFAPGRPASLAAILQMLDINRDKLDQLRTGIERSDWISTDERSECLESILGDTVNCDVDARGAVVELESIRALRGCHREFASVDRDTIAV